MSEKQFNALFSEYSTLAEKVLRYWVINGHFPAYGTLYGVKYTEQELKNAIQRVEDFVVLNKKNPKTVLLGTVVIPAPIPTPEPTPTPAPTPAPVNLATYCPTTTLVQGNTGDCVTYAQQKLQDLGYYKAKVDGSFGPIMSDAVYNFQGATGHTQDRVLGPKTWSSLMTTTPAKPGMLMGDQWVHDYVTANYGPCNTDTEIYNVIVAHGKYIYYYDQEQNQKTTVTTFAGNCADWVNDVGLPLYRAAGIKCRGVHGGVKCSDGKVYGHYWIELYEQGSGVYRDPAGWAAHNRAKNELICLKGYDVYHYEGASIPE